jgi:hypothetical protein
MSRKPRHPTAKPPERVVEEAAFHLANGTFVPVILGDRDYVSLMSPELGDQVMRAARALRVRRGLEGDQL